MTSTNSSQCVGRLAPSPTGVLHLGNARSFLLAWLSVRKQNGKMLLRIEDIDSPRVKPEAEEKTIRDLAWLGLDWDGPVVRQSDRLDLYREAAEGLHQIGLAYYCVCSRKDIEQAASAPHQDDHEAPVYPRTCLGKFSNREEATRGGCEAALRFHSRVDHVPFTDGFTADQAGFVGGDFVIQKKDQSPAYQLAVVVDDAAQGVTEVIRADDLLPSTPKQLLLYETFGFQPPQFIHLPLVVGHDGRRLAKRHGDTSLQYLRECGVSAESIIGFLAGASGLKDNNEPCSLDELLSVFSFDRLDPEPFVFKNEMLGLDQ